MKIIFFEKRILGIQFKIFSAAKNLNFRFIRNFQKIFFSMISVRLKVLKEFLGQIDFESQNFFFLKNIINFKSFFSFYFFKKNGLIVFWCFINFYEQFFQFLWNLTLIPFIEFNSDKFLFGFRPYRESSYFFFELNSFFFKRNSFIWILSIKFSFLNIINQKWFMKNFPIRNQILKSWINKKILCLDHSFGFFKYFFKTNIFFTFLSFIINGLV